MDQQHEPEQAGDFPLGEVYFRDSGRRATRTTSSRNSLGYGLGIAPSFQPA
ncbi:hypothetical protein [Streptomyces viridosporus]|uniref:hypothetical protein n=1 Tax=Streptomyces viridosporus TaxID=67581 RepID=UPI003324D7B8